MSLEYVDALGQKLSIINHLHSLLVNTQDQLKVMLGVLGAVLTAWHALILTSLQRQLNLVRRIHA